MPVAPRALVTGSSGFVAGHVVRRLVSEGHEVTGLDIAPPRGHFDASVREVTLDVRDRVGVHALIEETQPELFFHIAAQASVPASMRDPRTDVETNALATLELAFDAAEVGVQRFVFISTGGAMHGEPPPKQLPANEETPVAPMSVYGASKAAAEIYLGVVAQQTGLEVSILRPSNIYGPGQNPHGEAGVMAIVTRAMLRDEPVTLFGDGSQTRDYLYIDDTVEAVMRASEGPPDVCAISTGLEVSTEQIFELLASLTGYERPIVYADERPGDIQRISLDPARAARVWDWRPHTSFEDGVAQTVEWFRNEAATER
jgi:UDP-glucose 4-epimerase